MILKLTVRIGAVLFLAFMALTIRFHSFEWWWAPGRLHVLGRIYNREAGSLSERQVKSESGPSLHVVAHLPLGQAILAIRSAYSPGVIFVHEFDGSYIAYSLSGGP